jgi:hypothetical protein
MPERALARADDPPPHADAVRVGDRRRVGKRILEHSQLVVEMRVERQLLRDDERRDKDDPRAALAGEPASEIQSVLRLFPPQQRNDDAAVTDRGRPTREAAGTEPERADVQRLHYRTW